MKNKIVSLVMVLCLILPCAFLLCACVKDDQNQLTQLSASDAYEIFTNNLEDIATSSTISMNTSYGYNMANYTNNQKATIKSDNSALNNIVLKIDKGNFYVNSSELGEIYIMENGENYSKDTDENAWSLYKISNGPLVPNSAYISLVKEMIASIGLESFFEEIEEMALKLDSNALKVEKVGEENVITLSLDFANLINKTITNIKTNKNNTLETFINQFLKDYNGKDFNVMQELKNFTNTMTAETTIGDFLNYCEDKFDINLKPIVFFASGVYASVSFSSVSMGRQKFKGYENCDVYLSQYSSSETDIISFLSVENNKIFDLLDENNKSKDAVNYLLEQYLQNENLTINKIIESILQGEDEPEITPAVLFEYLDKANVNKLGLEIEIKLDSNNKIANLKMSASGDCAVLDNTKSGITLDGNAEVNINFSNIGRTFISAPTNQLKSMYVYKYIDKSTIGSGDITISLNEYPPYKDNLNFKVVYEVEGEENQPPTFNEDNPDQVATYDKTTKQFIINRTFYDNYILTEETCNSITFSKNDFTLSIIFN